MDDKNQKEAKKELGLGERIGAAIGSAAIGVGILSGYTPKTPLDVLWFVFAFLLLELAVWLIAPLFVEEQRIRLKYIIAFALLWIFIGVAFAIHSWPDTEPTSDLSVEVQMLRRFIPDTPPGIELGFTNKSSHTLNVYQMRYVGIVSRPFPSYAVQRDAEDGWWADRVKFVADSNSTLEHISFAPGKTIASVAGKVLLSQKEVEDLQAPNGFTTVYFMTINLYEDRSGTHELDSCMWAQNENVVHTCVHHNGPVVPIPHKPLNEKKWYWLWLN
jgi:hypothetical protein